MASQFLYQDRLFKVLGLVSVICSLVRGSEQAVIALSLVKEEGINTRASGHFVSYVIDTRSEPWIGKCACMFFVG